MKAVFHVFAPGSRLEFHYSTKQNRKKKSLRMIAFSNPGQISMTLRFIDTLRSFLLRMLRQKQDSVYLGHLKWAS